MTDVFSTPAPGASSNGGDTGRVMFQSSNKNLIALRQQASQVDYCYFLCSYYFSDTSIHASIIEQSTQYRLTCPFVSVILLYQVSQEIIGTLKWRIEKRF